MDAAGAVYVTGQTDSLTFPTANAFQPGFAGGHSIYTDAFVTKLNPYPGTGNASLAYSTYMGGVLSDCARGIAVDANGAAYIAGATSSRDFPILHAYEATGSSLTGFVAKLNPYSGSGNVSLAYSTYFGASNGLRKIAVDSAGAAYVVGSAGDLYFPVVNALRPLQLGDNAIVACLNPYSGSGNVTLA